MKTVLVVLLILVLIAGFAAFAFFERGSISLEGRWPFRRRNVLTPVERKLFYRLVTALPDFVVLAQVSLSSVIEVEKGAKGSWLNRINQKSLDYVICRQDFEVIAVIELDDSTHGRRDRIRADATKDKALTDARIAVLRWSVKAMPDIETIRKTFSLESEGEERAVRA